MMMIKKVYLAEKCIEKQTEMKRFLTLFFEQILLCTISVSKYAYLSIRLL